MYIQRFKYEQFKWFHSRIYWKFKIFKLFVNIFFFIINNKGNIRKLIIIFRNLGYNELSGAIPEVIGNFNNLEDV